MFYNYAYVHRLVAFFFSCLQFLLPPVFFLTTLHFVVSSLCVLTPILSCILVFIKKYSMKITAMLGTVQGPGKTTVRETDGILFLSSSIPRVWARHGQETSTTAHISGDAESSGENRSGEQGWGRKAGGCSGL